MLVIINYYTSNQRIIFFKFFDAIIDSCYECYWKEPYDTRCPIIVKYFDGKWYDYDITKIVKKIVNTYVKKCKKNHKKNHKNV